MDQPDVIAFARGSLKPNIEIYDPQLMFDERSAGFPVLAAPFDVGEFNAIVCDEKSCAFVGECIDHRSRTRGRIIVELCPRSIDVAGVEKTMEAIIGAIGRAPYQARDMG